MNTSRAPYIDTMCLLAINILSLLILPEHLEWQVTSCFKGCARVHSNASNLGKQTFNNYIVQIQAMRLIIIDQKTRDLYPNWHMVFIPFIWRQNTVLVFSHPARTLEMTGHLACQRMRSCPLNLRWQICPNVGAALARHSTNASAGTWPTPIHCNSYRSTLINSDRWIQIVKLTRSCLIRTQQTWCVEPMFV